MSYKIGSDDLNNEENNTYIDEVTKLIKEISNQRLKNIYFNIQNSEVIIRNIQNIKSKSQKEIIQLIRYEIGGYMPLNLQDYVIRYKKIINTKGKWSVQGILFPKKYVDICRSISEKLKIKKKYLYINFDILQKLINLRVIDLCNSNDEKVTIIENRDQDMILNIVFNKKIIESYVIEKNNPQYSISKSSYDENTYYYGISDDFINSLEIKKLNIKDKLILNKNEQIIDMTLDHLPVWGMII